MLVLYTHGKFNNKVLGNINYIKNLKEIGIFKKKLFDDNTFKFNKVIVRKTLNRFSNRAM